MPIILIGMDFLVAWFFVGALIHPPCRIPPPIQGVYPQPQEVMLTTADDLTIRAWYYPSQKGAAIIALGGINGSLGDQLPPIRPLLDSGYGVLQIDTRRCATPPSPVTLGYNELNDAVAGIRFLVSQPEVDPTRIGFYGFSMGGVSAIRTAARYPEISAVIAEGGYFNLGDDFVEPESELFFIQKIFLYSIAGMFWLRTGINPWKISPIDDISLINPKPIFLIYGEYEAQSGRAHMQFAAAGQPKELWIVPNGIHGHNHLIAPQEYENHVLGFFNRTLGE